MPTVTQKSEAPLPCVSTESDANHGTPLPNQLLDANKRITIFQNNLIAEGVTINISSSNCDGSTVTKLDYVAGIARTTEPMSSQPPLARQLVPLVEYGRESVIFNGNTFGQYVMINIASHHCTGASGSFTSDQKSKSLTILYH
ncbi:uncharacterized protein F5891DRAFT_1180990 [Suillus fuscotomentosus]|uniref:Uncharacterized protein n=1 Tax=Suillus fuscotomentosus TaxID=1912939 RepID=A0AAD4EKP5_9AGAM|nr:uncharacterized protein F5891DRAFT_1180990 [Suillus fuscotomentosus]KAG1907972.1 hypothetical protein F5891DRAFT_1180990 [Suillus fuscotomentosus]